MSGDTIALQTHETESIDDISHHIVLRTGVPRECQYLTLDGKRLRAAQSAWHTARRGTTIHLLPSGGLCRGSRRQCTRPHSSLSPPPPSLLLRRRLRTLPSCCILRPVAWPSINQSTYCAT
jgi:hypothetical protein